MSGSAASILNIVHEDSHWWTAVQTPPLPTMQINQGAITRGILSDYMKLPLEPQKALYHSFSFFFVFKELKELLAHFNLENWWRVTVEYSSEIPPLKAGHRNKELDLNDVRLGKL